MQSHRLRRQLKLAIGLLVTLGGMAHGASLLWRGLC